MTLIVPVLVALLVVCVLCYITGKLLAGFSVPEPIASVVWVVVVVLCLLIFLGALGLAPGLGMPLRK